jgi:MtN3 and saliva related transmembrane protein
LQQIPAPPEIVHMETLVASAAAILTTGAYLPQAVHIFRTKETAGVSLVMYTVMAAGTLLWGVFGILIASWPVIAANLIAFGLTSAIIALKLRYGACETRPSERGD